MKLFGDEKDMKTPSEPNDHIGGKERYQQETGAMGYILLWFMGVPASLLFVIFLLRGCN